MTGLQQPQPILRRLHGAEAWLLLAVALPLTLAALVLTPVAHPSRAMTLVPATVLHPEVLGSSIESREVGTADWIELADQRPLAFAASVVFCRRYSLLPLPNCRKLLIAAEARDALRGSVGSGPQALASPQSGGPSRAR